MATSGSGSGTPISGGVGAGLSTAQALPATLLSLPRYARIMGINPAHFYGATAASLNPAVFPLGNSCSGIWFQYAWQAADQVSREDLARAIYDAEQDIARGLGFWPAPVWIAKEVHPWPRFYRREYVNVSGLNVRGQRQSVPARWGKFIEAGRRAVTSIGTATTGGGSLAYTDEDGDGFYETATITLATSLTDACEIKAYHTGQGGAQAWEIRPARSKTISSGNVTIVFDAWLLIDPGLWALPPTDAGASALDISDVSNFVTSVDVYREYADFTQASAEFYWEPDPTTLLPVCAVCDGSGCPACRFTTQTGCLHVRDTDAGIVVPQPATYDSDAGQWDQAAFSVCRDPDQVKLWYRAGDIDDRYLAGVSCEPLSDFYAHAIAWLATARLERPFCTCGNVEALAKNLREDLAFVGEASYQNGPDVLSNPFGTRRGEVMAWRRIGRLAETVMGGGAV